MGRGLRTGGRAFQSTLSLRRATFSFIFPLSRRGDFNPRSPCGERPPTHEISRRHAKFQSTLSLRRATVWLDGERMANVFQSTLSLRRATIQGEQFGWPVSHFNPRSPCGERPDSFWGLLRFIQFQSTLSLRRATSGRANCSASPRISIHALLAESDPAPFGSISIAGLISIHALLAESDTGTSSTLSPLENFNPRSPCGERQTCGDLFANPARFQSTLSLRRATCLLDVRRV